MSSFTGSRGMRSCERGGGYLRHELWPSTFSRATQRLSQTVALALNMPDAIASAQAHKYECARVRV